MSRTPLLALAIALAAVPAAAQEFTAQAGYTRMPGRLGAPPSDHGLLIRAGVHAALGNHVRLGLEGGMERLNQDYRQSSDVCFLPGGGTGPCFFELWRRDTGWSLSGVARIHPARTFFTPYLLLGAGFLHIREHNRQYVVDAAGNELTNFTYDASFGDDALQLHAGAGAEYQPRGAPVGFTLEGRLTRLIHNYSGGIQGNWNPTVALGVRWSP